MKVRVDRERCMGHGMCTALAPELFHVSEETGFNEMGEVEIAPDQQTLARRGVGACPEQAITVLDEHHA